MDSKAQTEKDRWREYSPELGLLSWAVWDPIGAGVPLDGYKSYVPSVWHLLAKHARTDEIAAHLDTIAHGQMGVAPGKGRAAAEVLGQWWYWRFEFPAELESALIAVGWPSVRECHPTTMPTDD